ncbi:LamG domain-containing protein, partial [uncultured Paraglaciecola sp.]|uniref:LamG domain-containing protein n=1 Tax=uncultured Paraglaciecola sp. TaxID=1765024 RepID=UPI00261247A7
TGMSTSAYFDGSGDQITIDSNTCFDYSKGDFTIEAYVRLGRVSGTQSLHHGTPPSGGSPHLFFSGTNLKLDDGLSAHLTGSSTLVVDTWYHIAAVNDNGTWRIYVDGVQDASGAARTLGSGATTVKISLSSSPLQGHISNYRITNGVCRYPGGTTFTPPSLPLAVDASTGIDKYTTMMLHFEDDTDDSSIYNNHPDVQGDAAVSITETKLGTKTLELDGTGDYLDINPCPVSMHPELGDWTIDFWLFLKDHTASQGIFAIGEYTDGIYCRVLSSTQIDIYINGVRTIINWSSTLDQWYHVAFTRYGGTVQMWIDGVAQGSSWTDTSDIDPTTRLQVGAVDGGAQAIAAHYDEFRFSTGIARWTDAFTPPTDRYSGFAYNAVHVASIDSLPLTALSTRKLNDWYYGPCMRVRRDSDDDEIDIWFNSSGDLDETALTDFVGANQGFISVWYDQSLNSNNARQSTDASQPQITNASGVIHKINGVPSPFFDSSKSLYFSFDEAVTLTRTLSIIGDPHTVSGYMWIMSNPVIYPWHYGAAGQWVNTSFSNAVVHGGDWRVDGSDVASPSTTAMPSTPFNMNMTTTGLGATYARLCKATTYTNRGFYGYISEVITWPDELTSLERTTLESNQDTYWGL